MTDRRIIYLAASCAGYLALLILVPHVSLPRHTLTLVVLTAVLMLSQLHISRWFSSLTIKPKWAALVLVIVGVVWFAVVFAVSAPYTRYDVKGVGPQPVKTKQSPPPPTMMVRMIRPTLDEKGNVVGLERVRMKGVRKPSTLSFRLLAFDRHAGSARVATNLLAIFAATAFGYLLSFILRHPNILVPVGALAAYIDIWTVLVGPTAKAIENAPHVVSAVSVAMPEIGRRGGEFVTMSYIGPADFIFLAMFFGAVYRFKMEPVRTFWLVYPILTIGMISVITGFPPMGLPALVLIGPAVIVANFRYFRLTKDEYIAVGVVAALLAFATFVLTRAMHP